MGGRGAKLNRTNPYGSGTKAALAKAGVAISAGGGGAEAPEVSMLSTAGGAPDLSTFQVVKMSHNLKKWSDPNTKDGSLTVKDANGVTHKSIQVSSGSTRVTFEFKDFALKFENLTEGAYKGQNKVDVKAFEGIVGGNKKYIARPLTENRTMTINLKGIPKKVEVIAVERAVPLKREMTATERTAMYKLYSKVRNNGGNAIADVGFPSPGQGGRGHNVYVVEGKGGKLSLKFIDIALGYRRK